MKRYIRLVGVAVGLVASYVYAGAYQEYGGIEWHYFTIDDEFAVIGVNETRAIGQDVAGSIAVPSTLGGLPVKRIGANAFSCCSNLTYIGLSLTDVTWIKYGAFMGCSSLEQISLPPKLEGMEDMVFEGCERLRSLRIPEGVVTLHYRMFHGCNSLEELILPSTLETVWRNDLKDTAIWRTCSKGGALILNGCAIDVDGSVESIVLGSDCKRLAFNLFGRGPSDRVKMFDRLKDLIFLCEKPQILKATSGDNAKELFADSVSEATIFVPKDSPSWRDQVRDGKWLNHNVVGVAFGDDGLLAVYDEAIPGMRIVSYGSLMTAGEYVTKQVGRTITLPDAPSKELYDFEGWECDGILYAPGEQVVCMSDVVPIVAKWKKRVLDPPEIIAPTTYFGTGFWFEIKTKEEGAKIFYKVEDAKGRSSGTLYYDSRQYRSEETVIYAWVEKNGYFPSEEVVVRCVPAPKAIVKVQDTYDGGFVEWSSQVGAEFTLQSPQSPTSHEFLGWVVDGVTYDIGDVIIVRSPEVLVYSVWGREKSPKPTVVAETKFYSESTVVEVLCSDPNVELWYGLKYEGCDYVNRRYEGVFSVTGSVKVCAWSVKDGYANSDVVDVDIEKIARIDVFEVADDGKSVLRDDLYVYVDDRKLILPTKDDENDREFVAWKVRLENGIILGEFKPGEVVQVSTSKHCDIMPIWAVTVSFDLCGVMAEIEPNLLSVRGVAPFYLNLPMVTPISFEDVFIGWSESPGGPVLKEIAPFKHSATLYAVFGKSGGSFKTEVYGDGVMIVGGENLPRDVRIPDQIGGKQVLGIGARAFYCSGVTSVILPKGLVQIGEEAFYRCSGLSNVVFSGGCETVGKRAFADCTRVMSVRIGSIDSWLSIDFLDEQSNPLTGLAGGGLYIANELIETLILPDGLSEIKDYTFYGNQRLRSVVFSDCICAVGRKSFFACSGLDKLNLNEGLQTIGYEAFDVCQKLKVLTIPSSVMSIGGYAFPNGVLSVAIPQCVHKLSDVFSQYRSITNVVVRTGTTNICDEAFSGCYELVSVSLPDTVTSIGNDAFNYCDSLCRVELPDTIESIGKYAFFSDSKLKVERLPLSLRRVGNRAFCNCSGLTLRTLPPNLSQIDNAAFMSCANIGTELTIPASVKSIGELAFAYCTSLSSVYFEGDCPSVPTRSMDMIFNDVNCNVFVLKEAKGWGAVPGRWQNRPIDYFRAELFPAIERSEDVAEILSTCADARLSLYIDNVKNYDLYRSWVKGVTGSGVAVDESVIRAAPYAWASFATDSAVLLAKMPTDDDLKVEEFKPSAMAGSFDFTVSVKDVTIGDKASVDNLKKLFGLEGAESLDTAAFSSENVSLDFREPQDGKLKFTATPAVDNAKSFFMKAKVK